MSMMINVHKAFDKIGTTNGTAFPEAKVVVPKTAKTNAEAEQHMLREKAAYELAVAGALRAAANKRYDDAKEEATVYGVLAGIEAVKSGNTELLFDSVITSVSVKCNNPASRLDATKLRTELRKAGVSQDVIVKCFDAATTSSAPAKVITAVIK